MVNKPEKSSKFFFYNKIGRTNLQPIRNVTETRNYKCDYLIITILCVKTFSKRRLSSGLKTKLFCCDVLSKDEFTYRFTSELLLYLCAFSYAFL